MYVTKRSRMSLIMDVLKPELNFIMVIVGPKHLELFALELGKHAEFDFDYTLASTNINQSIPYLIKMKTTIRSRMSLIMDVIRPKLSKLYALELQNLSYLTLFTL